MAKFSKLKLDYSIAPNATVIDSPEKIKQKIENGGPIVFLGDEHADRAGHRAVADLMPTFAQSDVKVMGLEIYSSLNGLIEKIQSDKNLPVARIAAMLNQGFDKLSDSVMHSPDMQKFMSGLSTADRHILENTYHQMFKATGGEHRVEDWAAIIKSATANGIKIVGIDPRGSSAFQVKDTEIMMDVLRKAKGSPEKMFGLLSDFLNHQRSKDGDAGKELLDLSNNLPPGSKVTVMYGAAHGCLGMTGEGLVKYLTENGKDVTLIAVTKNNSPEPEGVCPVGLDTRIDPQAIHKKTHVKPQPIKRPALP